MKLYKRMIRPMVSPSALQGFSYKLYPLISDTYWVDEDFEDVLIEKWKKELKDPMSTIEIEEKYVEIELPEPKPIKLDLACEYVKGKKYRNYNARYLSFTVRQFTIEI